MAVNTLEAEPMDNFLTVGQAAERLGARPKDISDAFYRRQLNERLCPIWGGRRMIPEDYLPELERILRRLGHLREGSRQ
jgi:hypothetical protein